MRETTCTKSRCALGEKPDVDNPSRKMEVSVWRKISLSGSLRRLLVLGAPAVALFGLIGFAGWRLFARGTRRRRSIDSPAPETDTTSKIAEGQGSPAGSEDSGVADAGSQEGGSRKPSQENIHATHRLTSSRLTYHSGIKEFVPQHQVAQLEPPVAQKPSAGAAHHSHQQQQDVEAPLKEEERGGYHGGATVNTKGWPHYPTASSDLQSETFSELDSLSSSEGLLSMPPRSPVQIESSAVPSPTASGPSYPPPSKQNIPSSNSTSCFEYPASTENQQALGVSASKSTPVVVKQDRVRVILQLPKDLVGRFIGKQGRNIKALMADSNGAHVYVNQKNLPKDALIIPCTVQGTAEQVEQALQIIDSKYPEVDVPPRGRSGSIGVGSQESPLLSSAAAAQQERESWNTELQPAVIPNSPFKAMVSYIETLDRVWLVDFSKSSQLDDQHQSMSYTYCYAAVTRREGEMSKEESKALLDKYCAVRVSDIHWLRGKVNKLREDGENFEVQLMDYGSTVIVPASAIRPLRKEYSQLSVQAFPCLVANIVPKNALCEEGLLVLQSLLEGMMLEVHITGWAATAHDKSALTLAQVEASQVAAATEEEVEAKGEGEGDTADNTSHNDSTTLPMVELYTQLGSQTPTFINRELVERGFALWCEGEGEGGGKATASTPPPPPTVCEDKPPASEKEKQSEPES